MVKTKEVKLGVTRLLRFQHYLKLSPLLTDKVGRLLNDVVGLGGCRLQKSQEIKKLHLKMQTVSIIIFQFLKNTLFFFSICKGENFSPLRHVVKNLWQISIGTTDGALRCNTQYTKNRGNFVTETFSCPALLCSLWWH